MTQTGEVVSRSKKALLNFLSSTSVTSFFVSIGVAALVAALSVLSIIFLQLRASYRVQEVLLRMQHEALEETAKRNSEHEAFLKNMLALEEVVYGKLEPAARQQVQVTPVARVPLVRLERQLQELAARVTQLERWRLAHLSREH